MKHNFRKVIVKTFLTPGALSSLAPSRSQRKKLITIWVIAEHKFISQKQPCNHSLPQLEFKGKLGNKKWKEEWYWGGESGCCIDPSGVGYWIDVAPLNSICSGGGGGMQGCTPKNSWAPSESWRSGMWGLATFQSPKEDGVWVPGFSPFSPNKIDLTSHLSPCKPWARRVCVCVCIPVVNTDLASE